MAKLKPDYIEWVLKLNATQAQEEYHKLEKDNKELSKRITEARKHLAELEAQLSQPFSRTDSDTVERSNFSDAVGKIEKPSSSYWAISHIA